MRRQTCKKFDSTAVFLRKLSAQHSAKMKKPGEGVTGDRHQKREEISRMIVQEITE